MRKLPKMISSEQITVAPVGTKYGIDVIRQEFVEGRFLCTMHFSMFGQNHIDTTEQKNQFVLKIEGEPLTRWVALSRIADIKEDQWGRPRSMKWEIVAELKEVYWHG